MICNETVTSSQPILPDNNLIYPALPVKTSRDLETPFGHTQRRHLPSFKD